jgi:peptide/nickel transport system ATP-binding protein
VTELLAVQDVSVTFDGTVPAVRSVGFAVDAGEVVAMVGEPGSGKTVTAMSLLGPLPSTARVSGRAVLSGRDLYAMVFQEPMSGSSTCSGTCKKNSASRACSSATIWR